MRRIIKREDGGVSVVVPAPKSRREDETEANWLARVFDKATPEGAEYADVPASEIPSDRTFREAWVKNGDGIKVDMSKAREIHMTRIRDERDKRFAGLDVAYMIADEADNTIKKAEIKAKKKVLRDIPQTFDLTIAETPEQLKELWPDELT